MKDDVSLVRLLDELIANPTGFGFNLNVFPRKTLR
jgi:hypothetical protein